MAHYIHSVYVCMNVMDCKHRKTVCQWWSRNSGIYQEFVTIYSSVKMLENYTSAILKLDNWHVNLYFWFIHQPFKLYHMIWGNSYDSETWTKGILEGYNFKVTSAEIARICPDMIMDNPTCIHMFPWCCATTVGLWGLLGPFLPARPVGRVTVNGASTVDPSWATNQAHWPGDNHLKQNAESGGSNSNNNKNNKNNNNNNNNDDDDNNNDNNNDNNSNEHKNKHKSKSKNNNNNSISTTLYLEGKLQNEQNQQKFHNFFHSAYLVWKWFINKILG